MPRLLSRRFLLMSDGVYEATANELRFVNKVLLAHSASH